MANVTAWWRKSTSDPWRENGTAPDGATSTTARQRFTGWFRRAKSADAWQALAQADEESQVWHLLMFIGNGEKLVLPTGAEPDSVVNELVLTKSFHGRRKAFTVNTQHSRAEKAAALHTEAARQGMPIAMLQQLRSGGTVYAQPLCPSSMWPGFNAAPDSDDDNSDGDGKIYDSGDF